MPNVRKPRPPKKPESLSELILDLEERSPGDADAAVELPAEEWAHLVTRAEHEKNAKLAAGTVRDGEELEKVYERSSEHLQAANASLRARLEEREAEVATLRGMNRNVEANYFRFGEDLAVALGWEKSTGLDELLQVVRGCVMALEIEAELVRGKPETRDEAYEKGYQAGEAEAVKDCEAELIVALGCGKDTSWAELLEVGRGFDMAVMAEQDRIDELLGGERAPTGLPWPWANGGPHTLNLVTRARAAVEFFGKSDRTGDWATASSKEFDAVVDGLARALPPTQEPAAEDEAEEEGASPRVPLIDWDPAWDSADLNDRAKRLGMMDLYNRMLGETPQIRRPAYKEAHELFLAGKLGDPPAPKPKRKSRSKMKMTDVDPLTGLAVP